ncbi:BREX-2 system phosphatase PglZ [Nocardioides ochotonae]|uniref:BREX-2 system phosphatase PglZ n=1 Tax=Nocardioides ochotonae TaxID=2685869 RepID=UPI0014079882
MTTTLAGATARAEPGYVRQRAAALVRNHDPYTRVLILHAVPQWSGEPIFTVGDAVVHVRACESQLAVLDAYAQLPEGDYLVVLTDRTAQDLGDAVLLRAWRRRVEMPDLWRAVPALFGATGCSRDLHRVGTWAPAALLSHAPPAGWPPARGTEVTANHALGNLLAHLLGRSLPEMPDASLVLTTLDAPAARSRWRAVDPALRAELTDWAEARLGVDVGFALRVGAHPSPVTPLAVGLAIAALWDAAATSSASGQATGRLIERHLEGRQLSAEAAQRIGASCSAVVRQRLAVNASEARRTLAQAEAVLADLGWQEGAEHSNLLPAGLSTRLRALGDALEQGSEAAEQALAQVTAHALAHQETPALVAARMAVRLTRWLETTEPACATLSASLSWQVRDGAWVDRAVNAVWNGSDDGALSQQYAALLARVAARRQTRDRVAAEQLAAHAAAPHPVEGSVPVERLLADVVQPWRRGDGVLLVVLDGMSTAVASEIAENAGELGLAEWVPAAGTRMSALAALPSLTEISRTSLLSGELTTGHGAAEKAGFAKKFPGAPLFHKDDLRAGAGAQLPEPVSAAIDDTAGRPVVGVVVNTIDDTLHKQDVSAMRWTLDRLAPLRALLSAARAAGRAVVLTADHGHVVEHATEARPGNASRWRTPDSGPVGDGEVLVRGPRVLSEGGEAVLLWRPDVHYGRRHPGYHGGASLAEVTVPVIVLQRAFTSSGEQPTGPKGWVAAPPQAPEWWNEQVRTVEVATEPVVSAPAKAKPSRGASAPDPRQDTLFEVAAPVAQEAEATSRPGEDLVDAVLGTSVYRNQAARAGRRRPTDAVVASVLRALIARGNRAHRDTLAAEAGIAAHAVEPTLAAIKRIVNVDGYAVLEDDADRVSVKLDVALLRDQFGI